MALVFAGANHACLGRRGKPSFVLISLDTTRADHLGAYGYERDTTPFIDGLAERGFLFEQAIAPSANTLISHASLLTGLFPVAHGATYKDRGIALHDAFGTLPEDFAAAGYDTAAFLAHGGWLTRRFGFDQGFQIFSSAFRSAETVLAEAEQWLSTRSPEAAYFLFLHLFDVHSDWDSRPYDAPEPFRGRFAARELLFEGQQASEVLAAANEGEIRLGAEEVELIRDQYDEGLAYTDHELRRFFESLPAPVLENAWLVFVADHGEGFREHGTLLHASLHDEIVRVPMLFVPPAGSRAARRAPARIGAQVRLVDVRPTLLSLAGLPLPGDSQGVDLAPCLEVGEGRGCRPQPALLAAAGLRHEGFKLLGDRLYELGSDPGERIDVAARADMWERLRSMRQLLAQSLAGQERLRQRILAGAEERHLEADPEAEETLRALGYVD